MIAAALLGKRVEYEASSYHKVPAIAEYALRQYPVTRLGGVFPPQPAALRTEDLSPVSRLASFLSERSERSSVVVIDDLESYDLDAEEFGMQSSLFRTRFRAWTASRPDRAAEEDVAGKRHGYSHRRHQLLSRHGGRRGISPSVTIFRSSSSVR